MGFKGVLHPLYMIKSQKSSTQQHNVAYYTLNVVNMKTSQRQS